MKRSEAIARLKDTFFSYDTFENIAERALSAMEDAGMQPPRNYKHPSDDDRSPVYEWEEET